MGFKDHNEGYEPEDDEFLCCDVCGSAEGDIYSCDGGCDAILCVDCEDGHCEED